MEKKLIIVKPNTLSPKDKEKLTKKDYIVIEHPLPSEFKVLPSQDVVTYKTINCASCGDRIYLTEERLKALKENNYSFYCPQGHQQWFNPKK